LRRRSRLRNLYSRVGIGLSATGGSVSVSTSTTEATEKILVFWLGALGVLGGDWKTETARGWFAVSES